MEALLGELQGLRQLGTEAHQVKFWCLRSVRLLEQTVNLLDRGGGPHEPFLSEALITLEDILHDKAFDVLGPAFTFPVSTDAPPGTPIPREAYLAPRFQMATTVDQQPVLTPMDPDKERPKAPMRCYVGDLLGLVWLRLHLAVATAAANPWAQGLGAITVAHFTASIPPDLKVLCSGMGVVQATHAKHLTKLKEAGKEPLLQYFRSTMPDIPPETTLLALSFEQAMQLLQVVNFCTFSLDYNGPIYLCLRALAVCAARHVLSPPEGAQPPSAQLTRRAITALVGMAYDARRVRAIPPAGRIEIQMTEQQYERLYEQLRVAVETIKIGPQVHKECVYKILDVMVRRWDRVTFVLDDTLGKLTPHFMAPEMWGNAVYTDMYAFLNKRKDLWANHNLAPEIRCVLGIYILYFLFTTYYSGDEAFMKDYVHFHDTNTDGSPMIVDLKHPPMRTAVDAYGNVRLAPMFVRVGNIFAVWFDGALHTADNDIVALMHYFLVLTKDYMRGGLRVDGDILPFLLESGVVTEEEGQNKRQKTSDEADFYLAQMLSA